MTTMATAFPGIDQRERIENLLWIAARSPGVRALSLDALQAAIDTMTPTRIQRTLSAAIEAIDTIWSPNPALQQHIVLKYQLLLKSAARHLMCAIGPIGDACYNLYELRIFIGFLIRVVNISGSIKQLVQQLGPEEAVSNVQLRFSCYTSGWNLCEELGRALASPSAVGVELGYGLVMPADPSPAQLSPLPRTHTQSDRDETCSLSSTRTMATITSLVTTCSSHNTVNSNDLPLKKLNQLPVLYEQVKEQHPTTVPNVGNAGLTLDTPVSTGKFRLHTLEEHRFATRFQPKRVTSKTWRHAQRDANQLLRTGDRIKLAEALYLLLEIAWLSPRAAPLARNYLNIGSIYLTFDHLDEAAKAYRHCLHLDPKNWKARYNLGVALARLEDFVDSTKQLGMVLSSQSSTAPEITEHARLMLHELEELQLARNRLAFKQTAKARVFTSQFLNTLHIVSSADASLDGSRSSILRSGCGKKLAKKLPPVLLAQSKGWQGAIASLLHRLFVMAWCGCVSVERALLSKDPTRDVGVSLEDLDEITRGLTGASISPVEHLELSAVFGQRSIAFHFLSPRPETLATIDELQQIGVFRAALDWRLSRQYAGWIIKAPSSSGFRYWLALPMPQWINQALAHSADGIGSAAASTASVTQTLLGLGWLTPFDFGLAIRSLPLPDELSSLSFADRGALVFETHRTRASVQLEACLVIQMLAKRALLLRRVRARRFLLSEQKRTSAIINPYRGSCDNDKTEKEIYRHVTAATEALVDAVVEQGAHELRALNLRLDESAKAPMRTEFRLQQSDNGFTADWSRPSPK